MIPKRRSSRTNPANSPDGKSSRENQNRNRSKRVSKSKELLIVGIGASAGGLQAFTQLLRRLPRDPGIALVLVQHLAPKHESALSELLSRTTDIPVTEVKDGMDLEPNRVYVIPPDSDMAVHHGKLYLVPRIETQHHMPIDYFFRSLAEDQGSKAIGVVCSGTASDGTLGLKAIKAAGGITFAQSPESADHGEMPRNAIAAGCVDFVLPIKAIANELLRISHHPYLRQPQAEEPRELAKGGDKELNKIFTMLRATTGVDFSPYKPATLRRRIKRRMLLLKLDKLKDYTQFLKDHRDELEALFQDVLIHVTGFFRDPEVFETLKTTVFPRLVKDRPSGMPIRLWVAGCSTGEEAYSLAIALLEFLGNSPAAHEVQIFASDVNDVALDKARLGVYLDNVAADVSPERLRRFFVKVPGGYQIKKAVREICVFARHDVAKDPPFSHLDLISCRNLLIYLGTGLQKRILPVFHYALKPEGYLLLGGSESISSSAEYFSLADPKYKIFIKKMSPHPPQVNFGASVYHRGGMPGAARNFEADINLDVQKEADRIILNRYAPAGVIINEDFQIVQFRGRTGRYLEPAPGQASLNLTKMAREGLVVDLRAAVLEARKYNRPAKKQGVQVKRDGRILDVSLEAIPINGPMPGSRYFLVLFRGALPQAEGEGGKAKKAPAGRPTVSKAAKDQIIRLKEELTQNKSTLQSTIEELETINEELKSANEEILSSNEELQSTNEELETAKEELQSANEELTTLNEELQNRIRELSVANNDLVNLLASVNIPILILGTDLRIRHFTPSSQKLLNLIPSDVGRPLGDVKMHFELPEFERLLSETIESISVKEMDVRADGGQWYSMRIHPYRTAENKIEGAVVTWVEITKMKQALDESTQRYQFFFERSLAAVFYARKGRVTECNDTFAQMLGYASLEEVLKTENWDVHLRPEEQQRLYRRLLKEQRLDNVEVPLKRRDGTALWVQASVDLLTPQETDSPTERGVEGIIVDITRRVQAEKQLAKLSSSLMKESDDRRKNLARELHDEIGSRLAGLSASLSALERAQGLEKKVRAGLSKCLEQAQDCASEIQTVSYLQHPLVIDDLGLVAAVRWYAKDFSKRVGVKVETEIADSMTRLPAQTEIALYRVIQECLTNVQRYSGSRAARVRIDKTDKDLVVEVRDFGKGIAAGQEGMGIIGMRERMNELGGRLEIKGVKNKGTTVRAFLPLASLEA
jgi:two-component system, chemotaxis family, CheB/CheR fusion protein